MGAYRVSEGSSGGAGARGGSPRLWAIASRPLLRAALCAAALTLPETALGQQSQWVVVGQDASQRFASSLTEGVTLAPGAATGFAVLSTTGDRTVAELTYPLEFRLQSLLHTDFHRCGGYTLHPTEEAAFAEARNPFYGAAYLGRRGLFPGGIDQQSHVEPALNLVDPVQIVQTITWMQQAGTRYYESAAGQAASETLKSQWESYASDRDDFSVALYEHSWTQDSVIATIRGHESPDEIVVIGAHLDSINASNIANAPGADDDASGVAAVSEVLRTVLASGFKPRRTLQFMAYAAEEVGLRGSRDIAGDYAADARRKVVAALQLDMIGFAGSPADMYFVTDYVSVDLTEFLKQLIDVYNGPGPHQITFGETACGYACSDHVAWTGVGVPSAFPFEALFEDYNDLIHSPDDRLERIDTAGIKQAKFAKLGLEFMIEVAKSAGAAAPPPKTVGFVWEPDPMLRTNVPAATAYGVVTAERTGIGSYAVTFAGLGERDSAPVDVQVTAFGTPSNHCTARSTASVGQDLVVDVRCSGLDGAPVDSRHTVLVTLP
ncbi:M20/M25/M40 family metallo-hydrolase (plasmid) [Sinorhizobium meliloti]|nr:M20/M25/M40 family metallo-hydrolase [Sinorhizobium meliloti]WKL33749.1 M20/M25/M40 family metallo-hydrolase [Sinorhizobium meliloti]